jgi:hypothetical protein
MADLGSTSGSTGPSPWGLTSLTNAVLNIQSVLGLGSTPDGGEAALMTQVNALAAQVATLTSGLASTNTEILTLRDS